MGEGHSKLITATESVTPPKRRISPTRWLIAALCVLLPLSSWLAIRSNRITTAKKAPPTSTSIPTPVVALGSIVPGDAIIHLTAPTATAESRINDLLVQENQSVNADQIVATLDSRDRLQSSLREAEDQITYRRADLARVLAGSSLHEIASQRAAVQKLEADLKEKRRDYERFRSLHDDGIISDSDWEAKENAFQTAQALLAEGRSTLEHASEVRPVDVAVAKASLRSAESAEQTARANLEAAYVRAPVSGTVLKIYTRPGERLGDQGLLDLAPNSAVHVVAEVYETDASRLHEGIRAVITSESLPHALTGSIDHISRVVERQQTVNTDTAANTDARIVRTWILLDRDSAQVASRFNNLQVKVEFQP